jgi:hypothetical protein
MESTMHRTTTNTALTGNDALGKVSATDAAYR